MIPSNLYLFQIALLLKNKEMIPTEIAEHFNFTLPALSSHLRILKDTDLITEIKGTKSILFIEQEDDIRAGTILR